MQPIPLFECLCPNKIQVASAISLTGQGSATLVKYFRKFSESILNNLTKNDTVLGGEGIVDECKFGEKKYNRGHIVERV